MSDEKSYSDLLTALAQNYGVHPIVQLFTEIADGKQTPLVLFDRDAVRDYIASRAPMTEETFLPLLERDLCRDYIAFLTGVLQYDPMQSSWDVVKRYSALRGELLGAFCAGWDVAAKRDDHDSNLLDSDGRPL